MSLVCRGTFGVTSRVPSTVSLFRMERGTSLEMCSGQRASSCDDEGSTWFFSSCGGILELRQGIQASSCVGPEKSSFPFELRVRARYYSRVTAGQNRPHLGLCPGPKFPLQGRQGSRVAFQTHPRSQASSRGEAKDSTLFSSRDRYLLEPTEWSLLCRRALVYISLYIS